MPFTARKQPVSLLRIGLEDEVLSLDGTFVFIFIVIVALWPVHLANLERCIDGFSVYQTLLVRHGICSLAHDALDNLLHLVLHLTLLCNADVLFFHFILI